MSSLESWAFLCLMGCALFVPLFGSLFTGSWAIVGHVIAIMLGILSVSLYAASTQQ